MVSLGSIHFRLQELGEAEQCYKEAISLFRNSISLPQPNENDVKLRMGIAYKDLGAAQFAQQKWRDAGESFENALSIMYDQINDADFSNQNDIEEFRGILGTAVVAWYNESERVSAVDGNSDTVRELRDRGNVLQRRWNLELTKINGYVAPKAVVNTKLDVVSTTVSSVQDQKYVLEQQEMWSFNYDLFDNRVVIAAIVALVAAFFLFIPNLWASDIKKEAPNNKNKSSAWATAFAGNNNSRNNQSTRQQSWQPQSASARPIVVPPVNPSQRTSLGDTNNLYRVANYRQNSDRLINQLDDGLKE